MPDLLQTLLGRARPDPNGPKPQWTPEGEGLPDPLAIKATNLITGAFGLGDDSGASRLGELLGATVPVVGSVSKFAKWRPVLNELNEIISSSSKVDPVREALLSRVTPSRVFHRGPINIPKGFELPPEFGPQYLDRPDFMNEKFVQQRSVPVPEPRKGVSPRQDKSFTARLKAHQAPSVTSPEEILGSVKTAKPMESPNGDKKPLLGKWKRGDGKPKLDVDKVAEIKSLLATGADKHALAKTYNVDWATIHGIEQGNVWKNVQPAKGVK